MLYELSELEKEILLVKELRLEHNLFERIKSNSIWDDSMLSRKTVSYGIPYDYSDVSYEFSNLPYYLEVLQNFVYHQVGFMPNNCLINYYLNGNSKMGFHSDQVDKLTINTGIAIFSFGSSRTMRFKNKIDRSQRFDVVLNSNTFFYMSQKVQDYWLHSVLPDKDNFFSERISVTFRELNGSAF